MEHPARIAFLKSTDLFVGWPTARSKELPVTSMKLPWMRGARVFGKGDDGDAVYVIVEGQLRVESDGVHLVTRASGECVGEFALIDDGQRSATASAETAVKLLKWDRPRFQRALADTGCRPGNIPHPDHQIA